MPLNVSHFLILKLREDQSGNGITAFIIIQMALFDSKI